MSTLTQFLGGAVPVGGIVMANGSLAANYTVNGQEFLLQGQTKTYSSTYSEFASNFKGYCLTNAVASPTSWMGTQYTGSNYWGWNGCGKLEYSSTGSRYFMFNHSNSSAGATPKHGTSLSGAASAVTGLSSGVTYDSCSFGGLAILTQFNSTGASTEIYTSPNGTFTSRAVLSYSSAYWLAKSGSLCVAIAYASNNNAGDIFTSTDGITWTSRTPSINTGNVYRAVYSTVGNVFIYYAFNGIYTSPDGYTLTLRTSPANLPITRNQTSGIPNIYSAGQSSLCAASSTVTLIDAGQGKLLRTTDGINFTLVNVGAVSQSFAQTSSGSYNSGIIYHDGTRFVLIAPGLGAYGASYGNAAALYQYGTTYTSTDGLTWVQDFRRYSNGAPDIGDSQLTIPFFGPNQGLTGAGYVNSVYYLIASNGALNGASTRLFNDTGKIAAATPDFIGNPYNINSFYTGGINVYQRIL